VSIVGLVTAAMVLLVAILVDHSPLAAAREQTGAVIFTITLSGPVDPADAFGLELTKDECCFSERITLVCGAPAGSPACTSGTYRLRAVGQPVGTEISYALVRWPRGVANGDLDQRDRPVFMLQGTVVVHATTSHIHLTYVYPEASTLPDTAVQPPR